MKAARTQIVLDADVIIHFIKGNCFTLLPDIFPEYEYIILTPVYSELAKDHTTQTLIDNYARIFKKIKLQTFTPTGDSIREYMQLRTTFGLGESACMIYCRDHQNVLGSSNLKDIKAYCQQHQITYLTTLDFLYFAWHRGKMTATECQTFMQAVNNSNSRMPQTDITTYTPSTPL